MTDPNQQNVPRGLTGRPSIVPDDGMTEAFSMRADGTFTIQANAPTVVLHEIIKILVGAVHEKGEKLKQALALAKVSDTGEQISQARAEEAERRVKELEELLKQAQAELNGAKADLKAVLASHKWLGQEVARLEGHLAKTEAALQEKIDLLKEDPT